ncbi:MAG: ABC transporter substrate-binding protein [Actinobacteria bacterium]|nr:ABC transporter substrate-binding protein [Actinomycetota bacterium]
MTRSPTGRLVAVLLALVLVAASCSKRDSSNTVTGGGGGTGNNGQSSIDTSNCSVDPTKPIPGNTIRLVSSFPQSGLTAAFSEIADGWKAYFKMVNTEQGGVTIAGKKYKIETKDKDDTYDPAKTASNISDLVGSGSLDSVFGAFMVVGTAGNLAIRQDLAAKCVPDFFAATGSPALGDPSFPWAIGATNPPYTVEVKAFAEYLKKNKPNARVAVLAQDDDFGTAYIDGFNQAIKGTGIKVAKVEKYKPGAVDVGTQITSLAATKADAFLSGGTLLACPDSLKKAVAAGWRPLTYVSGTCASKTLMGLAGSAGDKALTTTNLEDPLNPKWANDPAMKEYRTKAKQYSPVANLDLTNGIVAYGWTQGALFVKALQAAKAPTRLAVMESVYNMNGVRAGLLRPGFSITTSQNDRYMGEKVQFGRYNAAKGYFEDLGSPEDFEGRTASITPKAVITGNG